MNAGSNGNDIEEPEMNYRSYITTAILQGIISKNYGINYPNGMDEKDINIFTDDAIKIADIFIEKLNN